MRTVIVAAQRREGRLQVEAFERVHKLALVKGTDDRRNEPEVGCEPVDTARSVGRPGELGGGERLGQRDELVWRDHKGVFGQQCGLV